MLHAPLKVNGQTFAEVQIVRQEEFLGATAVHTYEAWLKTRAVGGERVTSNISEKVRFDHVYADGALVCLSRAIQALREAGIDLTPPRGPGATPARHNHLTRDIKAPGECEACDEYARRAAKR